jgi:hypothetical protein
VPHSLLYMTFTVAEQQVYKYQGIQIMVLRFQPQVMVFVL